MRQLKAILLQLILGIIIFPWQLVCRAHPFGEEHHHPDGLSPCELRRIAEQQPGQHIFPPMECEQHVLKVEQFQPPQVEKIVPTIATVAILTVLFELPYAIGIQERPFILPPEPKCRSATLILNSPTRGSPLV